MFVQISSILPNILWPNLVWWDIFMSWSFMQKDWFAVSSSRSQQGLIWLKWQFTSFCDQTWFDDQYIIISQSILWGNWIAVFKVKFTAKLQNVNECLFRQYLLNHYIFYHQTWNGDASSEARVSVKKIGLPSSTSRSQQRIIQSKYCFLIYLLNCLFFCSQVWFDGTSS